MEEKPQPDRRKHFRFEVPLKVDVILDEGASGSETALSRDFSRFGIKIVLNNAQVASGATVFLNVESPVSHKSVPVVGEVAWAAKKPDGMEIGVEIQEMDNEVKSEILAYVYSEWKRSAAGKQ